MNKSFVARLIIILLPVSLFLGLISQSTISSSKTQWGVTVGVAWVSANKVSDSNGNGWFYMVKIKDSLFTFETRDGQGLYSIHYDLGNGEGWKTFMEPKEIIDFPVGRT